jgi:hypothetical protein
VGRAGTGRGRGPSGRRQRSQTNALVGCRLPAASRQLSGPHPAHTHTRVPAAHAHSTHTAAASPACHHRQIGASDFAFAKSNKKKYRGHSSCAGPILHLAKTQLDAGRRAPLVGRPGASAGVGRKSASCLAAARGGRGHAQANVLFSMANLRARRRRGGRFFCHEQQQQGRRQLPGAHSITRRAQINSISMN